MNNAITINIAGVASLIDLKRQVIRGLEESMVFSIFFYVLGAITSAHPGKKPGEREKYRSIDKMKRIATKISWLLIGPRSWYRLAMTSFAASSPAGPTFDAFASWLFGLQ